MPEREALIHRDEVATNPSKAQVLRRMSMIHTITERYGSLISEKKDVLLIKDDEPATDEEFLNSLESGRWLVAMKSEMDSMYENQVWTLVHSPKGIKPKGEIGSSRKRFTWRLM